MIGDTDNLELMSGAGTSLEVYRRFTRALSHFGDFERFCAALSQAVQEDAHLVNVLLLDTAPLAESEDELFDLRKVVVPLQSDAGSQYLRNAGRRDEKLFEAEDLHLLGAIADFVSVLLAHSRRAEQAQRQAQMLQYLIDQLPLGVVCFAGDGQLLIENEVAQRMLGELGLGELEKHLVEGTQSTSGHIRLHFEADEKLIYAEGRSHEVSAGVFVNAYVLYDLSEHREKLLLDLERLIYMSESRGGLVVVALLESRDVAGGMYQQVQAASNDLDLDPSLIQPLDAYTCVCIFQGQELRRVRGLLRHWLSSVDCTATRVSLVANDVSADSSNPAHQMIQSASAGLTELEVALLPQVLVLDAYRPVAEALALMVSDRCRLLAIESVDEAESLIGSGDVDGLIYDLDSSGSGDLLRIQAAVAAAGDGFRVFYASYKQPQMTRMAYDLFEEETLLQKPFDTVTIHHVLTFEV